ncbi:MAG: hexokinase [Spirochaetales bacterium]
MAINEKIAAFLGKYGMYMHAPDVLSTTDSLLYDMQLGLDANPGPDFLQSSHEMIPTWANPPKDVPKNESVIVIDAGGTNFRSCLVSFDAEGIASISNLEKCAMPGIEREYSKQEFFDTIAANLDHLKGMSNRIGFCFSYAMKITPDGDGEVISFSKEIKAPQVIGELVGANLCDALVKRGWTRPEKVVLLNDTVAALLAGASTATGGLRYSSYVGLILGTGMNTAYIESNPIKKIANSERIAPESQIVVCESGLFDKLPQSVFDMEFDKTTNTPNRYVMEKMCSGAYLGAVASLAVKQACKDGLFTKSAAEALLNIEGFTLFDMDRFFYTPYSNKTVLGSAISKGTQDDYDLLFGILDAFVDRCARLTAAIICAAVLKSGKGRSPALPVSVLCEGTTFYKTHGLKSRIHGYLHSELTQKRGCYFEIVTLDNAITLGAAVAGISV